MKKAVYFVLLAGIMFLTACPVVQPVAPEVDPPIVSVAATTTTNTVTWTWNNVTDASGYRYAIQSENVWTEISADTTSFTYTELEAGEYDVTLYVQAKNSAGTYSASGSAKTHVVYCGLPAPTVNGTSPVAGTSVTWTWSAVTGAINYRYSTTSSTGPWAEISAATTSHTESGLDPAQYTLWVQAKASNGLWSATGSKTINLLPPGSITSTLRLMAANLSSGSGQDYDLGHGIRIMTGCHPDVVMVQEFNYKTNSPANYQEMANLVIYGTATHAPNAYYYVEPTIGIPNGIISRYPIITSGSWDDTTMSNRDFAWARIDIPGDVDLWAVSIHIKASSGATERAQRKAEAEALHAYIDANVPSNIYLAVGGDFNTYSNDILVETCMAEFGKFTTFPDPNGHYPEGKDSYGNMNINTNAGRSSPYDRVLVNGKLEAFKTAVVIGTNTFAWGFVADTRTYNPIIDLSPALSTDSGADSMQHMGIVRDFSIP